jgi:hypothetical protein
MNSKWHNTRQISQVLEWDLETVQKHGTNRKKWSNNQFVLIPGVGGVLDV